jgi:hypothetical protein
MNTDTDRHTSISHWLRQSNNEAASAIERALAGTGVSPAAFLAAAQRMPQYQGQEVLLAHTLDAWVRAQALGPRPTSEQSRYALAEMRSLAAQHAGLAPGGSGAAATTGSAIGGATPSPSSANPQWQQRLDNTAPMNLSRSQVDADPATTHTTIVVGASGSIGNAYVQSALGSTNMPVVSVTSRPGEDQPGTVANNGISRRITAGNTNAARGQSRETRLMPAWQQQMRGAQNITFVNAAAPPMDTRGDNRFNWFARPTLPVWLANWIPLMQEKQPEQRLAVVNVINPGTSFANLQAYLGDDRTVPFGGGAVDVARTQDGARPNEMASVFGPHSAAMTGFYVSADNAGQLRIRVNESIPNRGPDILRSEGRWQTDPVGIAMQKEAQTYWDPILRHSDKSVHATLSIPLTRDDLSHVQQRVNSRLPVNERITLPERMVITAPRVFNPATQQWELDRPIFDALLDQQPFAVVRALRGTLEEYAQMKALLRDGLETLRPELRQQWRGMSTEVLFSESNREQIRQIVGSLTRQDAFRLQQQWR